MAKKLLAEVRKAFYLRVEVFGLNSADGGFWEDEVLIENDSPEEAYAEALEHLRGQGFATETKLTFCDEYGEDFA